MTLPIHFVHGLRSGSTLLMNLLGQCPTNHVTATNDLVDVLVGIRNQWMNLEGFKSQGLKLIEPRILSLLRGAIHGFYRDEIGAGKTVFDKSRGWCAYIELMEEILERPVKVIACVRDIRDVVASFEKKFRQSSLTRHDVGGDDYFARQTVRGRTEALLLDNAPLGLFINRLMDVYDRGLADRLVIVPYAELTANPGGTIARVHFECGLPAFICDPTNVQQLTREDDTVHGMDLHVIRPVVDSNNNTWQGIIPDQLADWLDERFSDIQKLVQCPQERNTVRRQSRMHSRPVEHEQARSAI